MKLEELCKQYGIPIALVYQFIREGILDDLKADIKNDVYGNEAVQRLDSCICLHSLGLDVKTIKKYIFWNYLMKILVPQELKSYGNIVMKI
ncbi:MAG: MerR family transcriptional regulator [Coprobacillus cateniformis]